MAELRPHVAEIRALGVEPYVIGSGSPEQARKFQEHLDARELPIFSDEKLASYKAAGWKRAVTATLSPRSALKYVKAFARHKQGKTMGDPWQIGGALLITRDGEIAWRFASEYGGHHPAVATLVDEARKAAA